MKRLLTIMLLLAGLSAQARNDEGSKVDLSLGIGGYPLLESVYYGVHDDDIGLEYPSLRSVYKESSGTLYSTGTIVFQAEFRAKKWLYIPLTLSNNILCQGYTDPVDGSRRTETNCTSQFMSGLQFRYMNHPGINFYSSFSVGIGLATDNYIYYEILDNRRIEKKAHDGDMTVAIQMIPFGIRFGRRIYGKAEIGIGTLYTGGLLGIGIRL